MLLSIITPTYNREYILNRLYESLLKQLNKNFEWVIVDDGSKDNTEKLCKEWLSKENEFNIKYIKQKNGGKHRALNTGIKKSEGDYILMVDSDDYIIPEATQLISKWIASIEDNKEFAGVSGNRKYSTGNMIGKYPKNKLYVDCKHIFREKFGITGDKNEVFKREILLQFPFKEFEDEKFLPESTVWNKISEAGYKIRYFPEAIVVCEYLTDGLTKNMRNLILNNFKGYTYYEKINKETLSFPNNYLAIARFIKIAKKKMSVKKIKEELNINTIEFCIGIIFLILRDFIKIIINLKRR